MKNPKTIAEIHSLAWGISLKENDERLATDCTSRQWRFNRIYSDLCEEASDLLAELSLILFANYYALEESLPIGDNDPDVIEALWLLSANNPSDWAKKVLSDAREYARLVREGGGFQVTTKTDPEVERIAELCWRTLNLAVRGSYAWPGDCVYPDNWRAVARAVLADRAAQPPATDGPTLMEVARQRDTALDRVDQSLVLVTVLTGERDDLQSRLDALARWTPSDDTLNEMRDEIPGEKSLLKHHWRAAARVVRDALLTAQAPPEVPPGEWTPERVAEFNAPFNAPALSAADILSGAEEMLRRIAATACLGLDATEAAAIVAELDRLRAAKEKLAGEERP